ncbi:C4-dicarboxylate TRAP transporter substrate-binding protein [Sneathiella sp.]|uniref:C4-dicarboxylate TRAP transporter substrate-binding protein n=1 Tax=Sneathiella sp. TaxID=1964365 RepID=UPI0035641D2B
MKKHFYGIMLVAFAVLCSAGYSAAETTKLIYANYISIKQPTNKALIDYFAAVEKDTNGSVVWEPHFASALLGPKDIPAGVRDGIADAGYFVGVYVPSEMPVDNYIGDFSMMNDDTLAMTGVNNELILLECEECDNEYREGFDTQFLATYALTDYVFQCKDELHSLADFKGKKIRGFSAWTSLIKELGAVPVSVSSNEMYEALDRGIIDCAMFAISGQQTRSLGELAKNTVLNSLGGFMGASMINLRTEKWDALTSSERTVLLKHLPHLIASTAFNNGVYLDAEVREKMEEKGNKFYMADEEVGKIITDFRVNYVKSDAIEQGKKRGVKNPEKIAAKIVELRAKWDKLLAENGRDQATFERLLWEQIYSKVSVK